MAYDFRNIEMYNTPEGDVMIKQISQPAHVLKESDREFIASMLTIIRDRYTEAHEALMNLYSKSSMNKVFYEFRVVHRFIRCNFGEYDQYNLDIDACGRFVFEEVRCPLRGECPFEGIICKPKLDTHLTDRELEVFRYIAQNLTSEQVASKLSISKYTIDRHRENIKARLGLCSVPELITYWHVNGMH